MPPEFSPVPKDFQQKSEVPSEGEIREPRTVGADVPQVNKHTESSDVDSETPQGFDAKTIKERLFGSLPPDADLEQRFAATKLAAALEEASRQGIIPQDSESPAQRTVEETEDTGRPLHEKLVREIFGKVVDGELADGETIAVTQQGDYSVSTGRRASETLRELGVVETSSKGSRVKLDNVPVRPPDQEERIAESEKEPKAPPAEKVVFEEKPKGETEEQHLPTDHIIDKRANRAGVSPDVMRARDNEVRAVLGDTRPTEAADEENVSEKSFYRETPDQRARADQASAYLGQKPSAFRRDAVDHVAHKVLDIANRERPQVNGENDQ